MTEVEKVVISLLLSGRTLRIETNTWPTKDTIVCVGAGAFRADSNRRRSSCLAWSCDAVFKKRHNGAPVVKMAPKMGDVLARFDFPLYTLQFIDDKHFLVAGGGGGAKTGIPNAVEVSAWWSKLNCWVIEVKMFDNSSARCCCCAWSCVNFFVSCWWYD